MLLRALAQVCFLQVRPHPDTTLRRALPLSPQIVDMPVRSMASAKLVHPDRLAEAVSRYVDWEAFTHWAGPALERGSRLPAEVAAEVERRCPGFLDTNINAREQDSSGASEG